MVSRKAGAHSQGDKQSSLDKVQQFLKEAQAANNPGAASSFAPPAVVSSSGFVPRTAATDAAKEEAKTFDRSQLLKVDEDDSQVQIYNAYAENANTNAEGVSSKRGLGAGSEGGGGPPRRGGFMNFVSAGGKAADTPAATGVAAASTASTTATAATPAAPGGLPAGWTMAHDPCSGYPYYCHVATGQTQWHPPQPEPAAAQPPPPPPPPPPSSLPAGWVATTDPTSGQTYYANPTTGQSSWTVPVAPPTFGSAGASVVTPAPMPVAAAAPSLSSSHAVKAKGLPATMSEADVRELFASCGRIVHVSLERGPDGYSTATTPKSGTIYFDALGSAQTAVKQMDGTKLRAYTIKVEMASESGAAARANSAKPY